MKLLFERKKNEWTDNEYILIFKVESDVTIFFRNLNIYYEIRRKNNNKINRLKKEWISFIGIIICAIFCGFFNGAVLLEFRNFGLDRFYEL